MKIFLVGLLAVVSLSVFAEGDISEFERGYKEGKLSCKSEEFQCVLTTKYGLFYGYGKTRKEAFEHAANRCKEVGLSPQSCLATAPTSFVPFK